MKPLNLVINHFLIPPSVHREIRRRRFLVSDWTLKDMVRFLNPGNKITEIVYHGINEPVLCAQQHVEAKKGRALNLSAFRKIFILTVGTFEPRENRHRA